MKKEKFNSISSEELEKEYKKVRKISAKVTKKKKSKREHYKSLSKNTVDYFSSQNDIESKLLFFKTLFLESLDYLINEHQGVINNLKPNEENFYILDAYITDIGKLKLVRKIIKKIVMDEDDWYK